jgi:hypothetical protein
VQLGLLLGHSTRGDTGRTVLTNSIFEHVALVDVLGPFDERWTHKGAEMDAQLRAMRWP